LLAGSEFLEHVGKENILPHVQAALNRAREITASFSGVGQVMATEMGRMLL
jgi:sulfate permease, SulP family